MSSDRPLPESRPSVSSDQFNVASASNTQAIQAAIRATSSKLKKVDASLDDLLSSHDDITRQLSRLDLSRGRLGSLNNVARALQKSQLAPAASTASRISEAVNKLDTEQERVKATLAVVEQVVTLRSCILGCVGSMGAPQDWETAASYLHRASEVPDNVVKSGFAESVVPTVEAPDPPSITLENCKEGLCKLFLKEFESATVEGDGAKVTRFFKMFPLISRSDVGLDAYGRYVCQGVAARARERMQLLGAMSRKMRQDDNSTGGMAHAQVLTKLFEHVAQVVDGHSSLVERHYGQDTMIKVIERLHREVDIQGGIILDTWYDDGNMDKTLTEVKSYAYNFLVQSFLNVPRGGTGTPRSASPAPGGRRPAAEPAEDGVEMRLVDSLLHESTVMLGHWSLYLRFVSSRAVKSHDAEGNSDQTPALVIPPFLEESALPKKVQKVLTDPFNVLATFFLRRSVEKAFQMEESPSGLSMNPSKITNHNHPYITSAVDDVMYIVNQVLQRSLATSQASIVASVLSTIGRVLGSDFVGMIQRKMRDDAYPKAAVQGAYPPEDKIIAFLVLANNLDVAVDYVGRIIRSHSDDETLVNGSTRHDQPSSRRPLSDLFPIGRDAVKVRTALKALEGTFTSKATDLLGDALQLAFTQILQPRLRLLITDAFRDVEYGATNHDMNDSNDDFDYDDEDQQSVGQRFKSGWQHAVRGVRRILSEKNHQRLISSAITYISSLLEKRIWAYQGRISEKGAVQFEKDVAEIINATLEGESFRLREKFLRCSQITTIMTMEEEEWDELSKAEESEIVQDGWVLSTQERFKARILVKGHE